MDRVLRLVTYVEVEDPAPDRVSLSARLEAELVSGQRVLLLDDRGWTSSGPRDAWAFESAPSIETTARTAVGPDEPGHGHTHQQESDAHWAGLAGVLQRSGVPVDGSELQRLPHDVLLSQQVRARLAGRRERP